ncbi:glycosyltransferase family 2 protein, partial [Patescibacteria group bacterium]|nr:glycosyltransferase family 2 protein [Patescibacteria group bacterium]
MKKPLISIIIPVKRINDYIRHEIIPSLEKQTFQNFELIILPDKKTKEKLKGARIIPTWPKTGPADKRDLGVKKAKGEIISFLDDDAYPAEGWI